ncbi:MULTISPECIES: hypothetical protein [Synechococcales]|uniref:hypothetical protein n=1 Tax=Synechococcus sp. CS-1324 TaxID=2847980 RepID=UPI00223BDEB5|nr:hypothetical protein [Synechococcus sp. CS-1324]
MLEAAPTAAGSASPGLSQPEQARSPGGLDDYVRLQNRLLLATLALSGVAVPLTAVLFGFAQAISLLVGSLAGLLYLRMLARSVARLGSDSRSVGKSQLLVPVVLVLAAIRVPGAEVIPALVGFLLYKPAILIQAFLPA